jgi:Fe-S-cluster containining protein
VNWEALDHVFISELDERLARGNRLGAAHLACRPGCSSCCTGLFPINELDALRLRQGMRLLRLREPVRADALAARAQDVIEVVRPDWPGEAPLGRLPENPEALDALAQRFEEVVCPVLDPATGWCELYAHRPVSCRTFGLPVSIGGEDLPPCALCFSKATRNEIERCRTEPDPDGLESAILCELCGSGIKDTETIIAFALLA